MSFKYPYLLLFLLIYIPLIFWWIWRNKKEYTSLFVSTLSGFKSRKGSGRAFLLTVSKVLTLLAIGFLIVALARPQKSDYMSTSHIYGSDIVLALDVSESMSTPDIMPTRFDAAKATATDFIRNRGEDNMGLVIFAGEALSIMPLTNDLLALQNAVEGVRMGQLATGTAIGDGIVSAINRVLNGKAKSKSIILITDGSNNTGDVAPSTAAEIAALKGIKVYTIGVGLDGNSVYVDPYGYTQATIETPIDEETLKDIANQTGGKYFRATDAKTLDYIFEEINNLEKTEMDVQSYQRKDECFMPWVLAALCCYLLVVLMRYTVLNKIP
ncbi:MAG: VWA domain-containing protein [Muribaculaceae bacterium]|nr:VWA domain-containing protein [Muribaculaceae bacterium]